MVALNRYADASRHIQEIQMRKIEPSSVYLEPQAQIHPPVSDQIDDSSRLWGYPAVRRLPHQIAGIKDARMGERRSF